MKKAIPILIALLVLAPWILAQTTNTQNNTHDNVRMMGGPNVATTDDTATITWKTDDQAATIVRFGTNANNLNQVEKQSGGARDHKIVLTGLMPGTTYSFAIMTNDGDVREKGQFTTKGSSARANNPAAVMTGGPDNVVITMGPELRNFNGSTATLYWETNNVAANDVRYGLDPRNLDQRAAERGGSRQHTAELSNLQPGRTYYFEILRRDGSIRQTGSFTLPRTANTSATNMYGAIPVQMSNGTVYNGQNGVYSGNGPVQIASGPTVQSVSDTQAVINWTTNVPASSNVRFGQSWLALNQQAQAPWGTQHTVVVSGLRPNTKYFFRVESAQAENTGQMARSQFGTFQTAAPGQSARAPR
jgi:phosphodiesterase/alkaline phosphatase D-like protein